MAKKQDEGVIVLSSLEEDFLTMLMHGDRLYGLELLDRINSARQSQGMRSLGVGSLYPTLKRMEEAKLIQGEWGEQVTESDPSRRKYYRITAEGAIAITRTQAYRRALERREQGQSDTEGQPIPDLSVYLLAG